MKGEIIIDLKGQLLIEQERLERICKKVKDRLKDAPEGTLRLSKSHGYTQYYHYVVGTDNNGKYISKKNIDIARQLAQKSYDKDILSYSQKSLDNISRLLKEYDNDKIEKIFLSERIERQELISPIEETYQQRVEKWMPIPYAGKGFNDDMPVIMTNSGIRVRSKSEKIIADYFDTCGILYKYECPLQLQSFGTIYPDFTFLSRKTGNEIYWEHEGMMDNPEYAKSAVKKIELYEKNGIFPGERLILTFESSITIINTEIIKSFVNNYLV